MGLFTKLINGLKKTTSFLGNKLAYVFKHNELNDEFYDELEEALITSDIGVETTEFIIDTMKERAKKEMIKDSENGKILLKKIIEEIVSVSDKKEIKYPCVISVVGVNGVGKTTSIGKLASYFTNNKKSVLLIAGDTFRAAACEQLTEWANRSKVRIISQGEGADSASVVFDGISSAKSKNNDVVIIDTAGRLHNKVNLMEELKKINKVVDKEWSEANKLNLIVLDATTGQNAILQVKAFKEAIGIDGIILTKLDGSAKGGAIIAIAHELNLPIYFVGVGEGINDIEVFDAKTFADNIL
jgi:fused signal recognition particle receptor